MPQSGIIACGATLRRLYVLVEDKSYIGLLPLPYMISLTMYKPIQLNMIAVMTSLIFRYALKMPGIAPQTAPKIIAASRQRYHGSCSTIAQYSAPNAPSVYCPAAPMLNRPVLNAKPTERPVIISGAAFASTVPILRGLLNPLCKITSRPSPIACSALMIASTTTPSSRPMTIQISEAATDRNASEPARRLPSDSFFLSIWLSPFSYTLRCAPAIYRPSSFAVV